MTGELFPLVNVADKAADVAVGAVSETGKPLFNAIGSTLAEGWQGLIGDRVAGWRIKNAIKINAKLAAKLKESGVKIDTSRVPEGYACTWFEEATKQDEPEIQELFATLLANAADGNEDALQRRNIEIVSKMTPADALLLSHIIELFTKHFHWNFKNREATIAVATLNYVLRKEFDFTELICVENLINLGVLVKTATTGIDKTGFQKALNSARVDRKGSVNAGSIDISKVIQQHDLISLSLTGRSLIFALFPEMRNEGE